MILYHAPDYGHVHCGHHYMVLYYTLVNVMNEDVNVLDLLTHAEFLEVVISNTYASLGVVNKNVGDFLTWSDSEALVNAYAGVNEVWVNVRVWVIVV